MGRHRIDRGERDSRLHCRGDGWVAGSAWNVSVKGKRMKMEVIENGRSVPKELHSAVLIGASERFHARYDATRLARRLERAEHLPVERRSVARAMLAVETRIVEAYWVLGLSTSNPLPRESSRNGIGYLFEQSDQDARYSDAASQNWQSVIPRPPVPSGREIDDADLALEWIRLLSREQAEIVSSGARSKRGDVNRRVNWIRVRAQMPKFLEWSAQRLRRSYADGIRQLAAQVTL